MSNSNYGIGGIERKVEVNEAIGDLSPNRTLIVEKLTDEDPVTPEITEGLTTINEVFDFFKPDSKVEFETADGATQKETLKFSNLGDFGAKGITTQSTYLKGLALEKEQYDKIVKQLRTNKLLANALGDPNSRKDFVNSLKALIEELEEAE